MHYIERHTQIVFIAVITHRTDTFRKIPHKCSYVSIISANFSARGNVVGRKKVLILV